jgi:hypothetical protein
VCCCQRAPDTRRVQALKVECCKSLPAPCCPHHPYVLGAQTRDSGVSRAWSSAYTLLLYPGRSAGHASLSIQRFDNPCSKHNGNVAHPRNRRPCLLQTRTRAHSCTAPVPLGSHIVPRLNEYQAVSSGPASANVLSRRTLFPLLLTQHLPHAGNQEVPYDQYACHIRFCLGSGTGIILAGGAL